MESSASFPPLRHFPSMICPLFFGHEHKTTSCTRAHLPQLAVDDMGNQVSWLSLCCLSVFFCLRCVRVLYLGWFKGKPRKHSVGAVGVRRGTNCILEPSVCGLRLLGSTVLVQHNSIAFLHVVACHQPEACNNYCILLMVDTRLRFAFPCQLVSDVRRQIDHRLEPLCELLLLAPCFCCHQCRSMIPTSTSQRVSLLSICLREVPRVIFRWCFEIIGVW